MRNHFTTSGITTNFIANTLSWEICRQNILAAFRKEDGADIAGSADAISGILDAWTEIGPQVRQVG